MSSSWGRYSTKGATIIAERKRAIERAREKAREVKANSRDSAVTVSTDNQLYPCVVWFDDKKAA